MTAPIHYETKQCPLQQYNDVLQYALQMDTNGITNCSKDRNKNYKKIGIIAQHYFPRKKKISIAG